MDSVFSRSVAAQQSARCVIAAAETAGLLAGQIAVDPAFADGEKTLMVAIMRELSAKNCAELTADQVSSLFTFVFAKAAEKVTNFANGRPDQWDMLGLLDGKTPICAADQITGKFKLSSFPTDCARNFWEFYASGQTGGDTMLCLMEALKWCFRFSCHYAVSCLEEDGFVFC